MRKRRIAVKRSIVYIAIGFSVLLAGLPKPVLAQIPFAETNAAPAAASLGGVDYVAWKGKKAQDIIYYATSSSATENVGTGEWSSQQQISFAKTTQAPALATAGNTLFLAWRGQSTNATDSIFYSTNTGSGWNPQQTCGSNCETTAVPALAATCQSGTYLGECSTAALYMAWTTESDTIEVASIIDGVWTILPTQPSATPYPPYPGTAPALAVYGDQLFLAWVQEGTTCDGSPCFQFIYETYSLSDDAWSPATPTTLPSSSVPVAPALSVYAYTGDGALLTAGLYMARYVVSSSGAEVDYSEWGDGSWDTPTTVVPTPGLPVPPGPLTPALVFTDTTTSSNGCTMTSLTFSLVYAANVSGQSYDDIYFNALAEGAIHGCLKPPPSQ
jgi:hypothetical protein